MSHNIVVPGGTTVRLPTAGKYCDRDILVTAEGGSLSLDVVTASALPGTVVDGQIVVITETAAGTVYIDTDEPVSPVAGDLWIEVAAGGSAALELTEESPYLRNGITEAKQWNGNTWARMGGYLGVNGSWVQFAVALPPVGTALNDMTWEQISLISQKKLAKDYFVIGDAKEITINGSVGAYTFSNFKAWAFIVGIYHDPEHEGGYFITFQICMSAQNNGKKLCLADNSYGSGGWGSTRFIMNSMNTGGWAASVMRTKHLGSDRDPSSPPSNSLLAALPSELRAVMRVATKYTGTTKYEEDEPNIPSTSDCLWLLSEFEVFGKRTYAPTKEQNHQKQYEYYASGNNKLFYKHSDAATVAAWWLRSLRVNNAGFCNVSTSGGITSQAPDYSYGIAPCFGV